MKQFEYKDRSFLISEQGLIYNIDGIEQNLRISRGYLYFRRKSVHRIVARCFCEDWFEGCEVHHLDHNKLNNDISNLVCLTKLEHKKIHRTDEPKTDESHIPKKKKKKKRRKRFFNKKYVINK